MTRHLTLLPASYPDGVSRPRTRGECVDGPRPCPWASCRHHTLLDVTKAGRITMHRLDVEDLTMVDEDGDRIDASCSLDLAEQGPRTLSQVGSLFGFGRERSRQIEAAAIVSLRSARGVDVLADAFAAGGFEDSTADRDTLALGSGPGSVDHFGEGDEQAEGPADDADASFLARMWRAYSARSEAHPHPLGELLRQRPWEAPHLDVKQATIIRRAAVVEAYTTLAKASGSKPKMLDVARRAGLRGEGSRASAIAQSNLRLARAEGADLPHFNDGGPLRAAIKRASNEAERKTEETMGGKVGQERKQQIHETYLRLERETGRRPSAIEIGAALGIAGDKYSQSAQVNKALRALREEGAELPRFDEGSRRGRKPKAAEWTIRRAETPSMLASSVENAAAGVAIDITDRNHTLRTALVAKRASLVEQVKAIDVLLGGAA